MKMNKKKYFLIYSLLFICFAGYIVFSYYSIKKSLINYAGDGYRQHFRGLVYTSKYLKDIVTNLFNTGKLIIPNWDFAIGEGSDIFQTFHYYGLNDPLNLFGIFFKEEHLYLYYDLSIVIRLYLSGLVFSILCFYAKNDNYYGILAGSLIYAFNSYAIISAVGHIYFLNAFIYFPLILLGAEKIVKENRGILLSISVFLSIAANIYFFYMNVIGTVLYVIVRVLLLNNTVKEKAIIVLKIFIYSFIGLLIGGYIFMPQAYSMLNNSRLSFTIESNILYSINYYLNNVSLLVYSTSYFGGYTICCLFAVIAMFSRNKEKLIKWLFIVGIILLSLPVCSRLFNALTYETDRWLFILDLLFCYILVDNFDLLIDDIKKRKIIYIITCLVFFIISFVYNKQDYKIFALITLLGIGLIVLLNTLKKENYKQLVCLVVCLVSILLSLFFKLSPGYWNYAKNGTDIDLAKDICNGEYKEVEKLNDGSFFRYSGDSLITNASIFGDTSSTGYYWSVANNNVTEFRKDLGLSDKNNHHYDDYDDNYVLNSLAGVKYYIKKDGDSVPYNYNKVSSSTDFEIYEGKDVLPLIYGYDFYITRDSWDKLSVIERLEALTQGVVIDSSDILKETNINTSYKKVDYSLECLDGISIDDNQINISNSNSSINLKVKSNEVGEYYLAINGLDSSDSAYISVNNKQLIYKSKTNPEYTGKEDFLINLGYREGFDDEILITFPNVATYNFKEIGIICLPLDTISDNFSKLNNVVMNDLEINSDYIKANISLDKNEIVCLSIPYSEGFKAYVDGKEADLLKTNIQYMGIYLDKGNHIIELEYNTPLLKEGLIASLIGIISLTVIEIIRKKYITKH